MILLAIILSLLLAISISLNGLLYWYNRRVVEKILFVSDNIGDTMGLVKEYHEHLESLHAMEMFYGDETLRGLIDHTNFIVGEMRIFEDVYSLTREEDTTDYDETEANYPPEAEAEAEETQA